ncbi:hypothetical protein D9M71_100070 [compost metagenome]
MQALAHHRREAQVRKGEKAIAQDEGDHRHAKDQPPVIHECSSLPGLPKRWRSSTTPTAIPLKAAAIRPSL